MEYGYKIVVTHGVAMARSNHFLFTTIPMISSGSIVAPVSCPRFRCSGLKEGSAAFSFAITSSLSAICLTCFGETKLTASMWRNPASASCLRYSALYSVGMNSCNPCHASRGHSITFTVSMLSLQDPGFEFGDVGIQSRRHKRPPECLARMGRIDDGIDPQARSGVTRIGLMLIV